MDLKFDTTKFDSLSSHDQYVIVEYITKGFYSAARKVKRSGLTSIDAKQYVIDLANRIHLEPRNKDAEWLFVNRNRIKNYCLAIAIFLPLFTVVIFFNPTTLNRWVLLFLLFAFGVWIYYKLDQNECWEKVNRKKK